MGYMYQSEYRLDEPSKTSATGAFERERSNIREWITSEHAEPGRLHLYLAINCPWAHRAWLTVKLLGLTDVISMSFVRPKRTEQGWIFDPDGRFVDDLHRSSALHEIYACLLYTSPSPRDA